MLLFGRSTRFNGKTSLAQRFQVSQNCSKGLGVGVKHKDGNVERYARFYHFFKFPKDFQGGNVANIYLKNYIIRFNVFFVIW